MLYLTQIITLDNSPKHSCPFFSSPYGYLGQLVLLYILVDLSLFLSVFFMLGTHKVVVVAMATSCATRTCLTMTMIRHL